MIGFFSELKTTVDEIRDVLKKQTESEAELSVFLMRRLLGSIDVGEELNPEVFNNRAGAIFKDVVEPKLKAMSREQERFTAAEAANWEQALFGRGTLNGIELVREEFEKAYGVYQQSLQPKEQFDEKNPLPEI